MSSIGMHVGSQGGEIQECHQFTQELLRLSQSMDESWCPLGSLLRRIRDEQLYRKSGYRSFANYCRRALPYTRQHVYKLIKLVIFIENLPITLRQNRGSERLVKMGLTKLYMLHTLPVSILEDLLANGVSIERKATGLVRVELESLTICQLRTVVGPHHGTNKKPNKDLDHLLEQKLLKELTLCRMLLSQLTDQNTHSLA